MALSYQDSDFVNSGTTSWTASSMSIGTASSDRWVIVAVWVQLNAGTGISSVTIGGNSASSLGTVQSNGAFRYGLYAANVTTGTTADVVVTVSGGTPTFYESTVDIYIEDAGEPTFDAVSTIDTSSSGSPDYELSTTITTATDGNYIIGFAHGTGGATGIDWTAGATEDAEQYVNTFFRTSVASEVVATAETNRSVTAELVGATYQFNEALIVWSLEPPASGSNTNVSLDAGSYTETGLALSADIASGADSGAYVLSGFDTSISATRTVSLDVESYVWTDQDASISVSDVEELDQGAYVLSGFDTTETQDTNAGLDTGSFSVSGFDVSISTAGVTSVPLDSASYTVSGLDVSLSQIDVVSLDATSYTLAGFDVDVSTVGSTLVSLDAGSYTLTGLNNSIATGDGTQVPLDAGSFVWTGYSGNESFYIPPGLGSYTLTGNDAIVALSGSTSVSLDPDAFALSGFDVGIGEGQEAFTGTLTTTGSPDEFAIEFPSSVDGTLYLAITASSSPPPLQATPPGFGGSVLWSDSLSLTGSTGAQTFSDLNDLVGDYFLHSVFYRTSDAAFSPVDTDAYAVPMSLDTGSYTLSGESLILGELVDLLRGQYSLSGYELDIPQGAALVTLDGGAYSISGAAATLAIQTGVDSAAYSLTGFDVDVGLSVDVPVSLDAASYTLTGLDNFISGRVPLSPGTFTLSGFDVAVISADQISLDTGSYTVSGSPANVVQDVSADSGGYTLTGHDVDASANIVFLPDAGDYSLTGGSLQVSALGIYQLEGGSFVLTGLAADIGQSLLLGSGSYSLTGFNFPIVLLGQSSRRVATAANSSNSGSLNSSQTGGTFNTAHNSGTLGERR